MMVPADDQQRPSVYLSFPFAFLIDLHTLSFFSDLPLPLIEQMETYPPCILARTSFHSNFWALATTDDSDRLDTMIFPQCWSVPHPLGSTYTYTPP